MTVPLRNPWSSPSANGREAELSAPEPHRDHGRHVVKARDRVLQTGKKANVFPARGTSPFRNGLVPSHHNLPQVVEPFAK
jgi:hypothetical protein